MITTLVAIFIIGYLAIAFEHPLKINKAAPALMIGVLMWAVWVLSAGTPEEASGISHELGHHLYDIAQILFFLLGAMTIVELIDSHQGFKVITNRIKTKDARKLLWIISIITFFLSAALDNLTTAIVMVSLLRRLVHNENQRKIFIGMVVIAANAGGAWSPIGDVTTTMLWIGGQISSTNIIKTLIIPSLVCMIVPLFVLGLKMKGSVERAEYDYKEAEKQEDIKGSKLMFFLGVGMLLFVPVFKQVTHLPPFMGMMLGLAVVWIASELLHIDKTEEEKKPYTALHALSKIDTSAILFFMGILLAISTLQGTGVLGDLAQWMDNAIGNQDVIAMSIGLLSSIVDNVPLVAAAQKMYTFPVDHKMWEFIAYAAGTGGSCLIIGSAAGVAVMGMEKIDFIWYLKKMSWLALIGFFAGAAAYMLVYPFFAVHH